MLRPHERSVVCKRSMTASNLMVSGSNLMIQHVDLQIVGEDLVLTFQMIRWSEDWLFRSNPKDDQCGLNLKALHNRYMYIMLSKLWKRHSEVAVATNQWLIRYLNMHKKWKIAVRKGRYWSFGVDGYIYLRDIEENPRILIKPNPTNSLSQSGVGTLMLGGPYIPTYHVYRQGLARGRSVLRPSP